MDWPAVETVGNGIFSALIVGRSWLNSSSLPSTGPSGGTQWNWRLWALHLGLMLVSPENVMQLLKVGTYGTATPWSSIVAHDPPVLQTKSFCLHSAYHSWLVMTPHYHLLRYSFNIATAARQGLLDLLIARKDPRSCPSYRRTHGHQFQDFVCLELSIHITSCGIL